MDNVCLVESFSTEKDFLCNNWQPKMSGAPVQFVA